MRDITIVGFSDGRVGAEFLTPNGLEFAYFSENVAEDDWIATTASGQQIELFSEPSSYRYVRGGGVVRDKPAQPATDRAPAPTE